MRSSPRLPRATFSPAGKRTKFGGRVELVWSEGLVDRWIAERVAAAEKTLRLLRK